MATPQQIIARLRANRAATALGSDIPRPNPAAAAVPELRQAARGYDGARPAIPRPPVEVPALPAVPPDAVAALVRKVSQEGVDALTPDEAILFDDIVAGRVRVSEVDSTAAAREVLEEAAPVEGDLPAATGSAEQVDNLESSAIDLDTPTQQGNPNLRVGRKKKQSPAEIAANEVQQLTTDSGEAISPRQIKRTLAKVNNLGRDGVVAALGPDGERRLARLEEMASDAARDPNAAAAASIATAADARTASGTPRSPRQPAMAGMEPNAFGVTPGLPGLIERFNALPDAVRAGVVRRLQANPNAASLFEAGGGVDSISPNRFAELLRPVNEVDELLQQADQFRAIGDNASADAALALAREASREVRTPALSAFTRRKAVEAALSEALPAADPSPQVMASPGQPALRRPGDLTPEFATDEAVTLPTQADDALASLRERMIERENRAPGGGTTQEQRMEAVGAKSARKLPIGLAGRDRPTPLESRSRGERSIEGNDIRVLRPLLDAREKLAAATTADEQAAALAEVAAAEAEIERKYRRKGRKEMSDSRLNKPGQQETLDELAVSAAGFRPRAESNLNRASDSLSASDRAALQDEAVRAFGEQDASDLMPEPGELDDVSVLGEGGKRGRLGGGSAASRWMNAVDQLFAERGVNPLDLEIYGGDPLAVADDVLSRQRIFKPGTANYDMAREQLAKEIALRYGGRRTPAEQLLPRPEEAPFRRRFERPAPPAEAVATSQDPASLPATQGSWPEGTMRQKAVVGPNPSANTAGTPTPPPTESEFRKLMKEYRRAVRDPNYLKTAPSETLVDLSGNPVTIDVSGKPLANAPARPKTANDFSQPTTTLSPEDEALLASNFEIDVADDLPAADGSAAKPAASGKKSGSKKGGGKQQPAAAEDAAGDLPPATGRKLTNEEIQEQADQVFQEEYQRAVDEGMSTSKARTAANKARKKTVDDLKAANKDLPDAEGTGATTGKAAPQTAAGGGGGKQPPKDPPNTPKDKPAADASDPADSTGDLDPATGSTKPKDAGDAAKPDGPQKKPGKDADGKPEKPGTIRRLLKDWKKWAVGGGLVGLGLTAWDYLDDSENAPIDIPGGGGGGDGQGSGRDINLPVPPGGVPLSEPEPLTQEQKVRATLDRIRAQRAAGIGSRGTQTLQNF